MVEAARAAGGEVAAAERARRSSPPARIATPCTSSPAITHTIGGLRIDRTRASCDDDGAPIDGLYAAGADAGGIATGGYASGLASALVFGRLAAETALERNVRSRSRVRAYAGDQV